MTGLTLPREQAGRRNVAEALQGSPRLRGKNTGRYWRRAVNGERSSLLRRFSRNTEIEKMKVSDLKTILAQHSEALVRFVLPNEALIPAHAHVTEAARVEKRFVDCGGSYREESLCRLQTWVADDLHHRLSAGKLVRILQKAEPVLHLDNLELDVEYEVGFISQFPVKSVEVTGNEIVLRLSERHTACLAQDQCCPPSAPKFTSINPMNFTFQRS